MAQISGGGSDREVAADVNIIPFIDLMSVCIIFLLITAVWTQISMIQLGSSVYGKQQNEQEDIKPKENDINLHVFVRQNGYIVKFAGRSLSVPKVDGQFDRISLFAQMKGIKQAYPQANNAIISIADDLTYNEMVEGMDVLMQSGFPDIVVSSGE